MSEARRSVSDEDLLEYDSFLQILKEPDILDIDATEINSGSTRIIDADNGNASKKRIGVSLSHNTRRQANGRDSKKSKLLIVNGKSNLLGGDVLKLLKYFDSKTFCIFFTSNRKLQKYFRNDDTFQRVLHWKNKVDKLQEADKLTDIFRSKQIEVGDLQQTYALKKPSDSLLRPHSPTILLPILVLKKKLKRLEKIIERRKRYTIFLKQRAEKNNAASTDPLKFIKTTGADYSPENINSNEHGNLMKCLGRGSCSISTSPTEDELREALSGTILGVHLDQNRAKRELSEKNQTNWRPALSAGNGHTSKFSSITDAMIKAEPLLSWVPDSTDAPIMFENVASLASVTKVYMSDLVLIQTGSGKYIEIRHRRSEKNECPPGDWPGVQRNNYRETYRKIFDAVLEEIIRLHQDGGDGRTASGDVRILAAIETGPLVELIHHATEVHIGGIEELEASIEHNDAGYARVRAMVRYVFSFFL